MGGEEIVGGKTNPRALVSMAIVTIAINLDTLPNFVQALGARHETEETKGEIQDTRGQEGTHNLIMGPPGVRVLGHVGQCNPPLPPLIITITIDNLKPGHPLP